MMKRAASPLLTLLILTFLGCAKMGRPDGGWFDETPPHVVTSAPIDKACYVETRKIYIYFDEFIKLDNPSEKVVVSPPQIEVPDIKAQGKRISIQLNDSLIPNTTYTIDFSDAISDNNEGNPLGNYTYSFSTGGEIDTMEVSGYILEAENLEPIKGILVGLYEDLSDSAFTTKPLLRVSRTDSRGRFIIKGIAPGQYRVYAINDMDANYFYSQKSEKMAFSHEIIVPSFKPDVRQDTLWRDSIHIDNIIQTGYTHFLPDDIVLRAFTTTLTDRFLIKTERVQADKISFFFTYGHEQLPEIEGVNFDARDAFLIETNLAQDTVHYWLRDTALVNQDTLQVIAKYWCTDTIGNLYQKDDTLEIFAKMPYAKRMKELEKEREKWEKAQEKAKKKGNSYLTVMPPKPLEVNFNVNQNMPPDGKLRFESPTPLAYVDTALIHIEAKVDTLWVPQPYILTEGNGKPQSPNLQTKRIYELATGSGNGLWTEGGEYRLVCDSAAFIDIYGMASKKQSKLFKVMTEDDYTTIIITILHEHAEQMVAQLLDRSDKVVDETPCTNGTVQFHYVKPGSYYLRTYTDNNGNGRWDTGDYEKDLQAETVFYYPEVMECKAKWTFERDWSPEATPPYKQKRPEITKQKPDKEKKIRQQNAERARKLGIQYPNNL